MNSDSRSFFAYVRSKQDVRDKVRPREDNAGNIITQGFLMTEELNNYALQFSVHKKNTCSLPVPETRYSTFTKIN